LKVIEEILLEEERFEEKKLVKITVTKLVIKSIGNFWYLRGVRKRKYLRQKGIRSKVIGTKAA